MMAASPTISSISSLRWREPPEMAACAKTNSFTATCSEFLLLFLAGRGEGGVVGVKWLGAKTFSSCANCFSLLSCLR